MVFASIFPRPGMGHAGHRHSRPIQNPGQRFFDKENRCLTLNPHGKTQILAQQYGAGILTLLLWDSVSRGYTRHGNDTSEVWPRKLPPLTKGTGHANRHSSTCGDDGTAASGIPSGHLLCIEHPCLAACANGCDQHPASAGFLILPQSCADRYRA